MKEYTWLYNTYNDNVYTLLFIILILSLIILALFIFFLDVYGFKAVKMGRSFINDVVFRVSYIASSPSRLMPNLGKGIAGHLNLKEESLKFNFSITSLALSSKVSFKSLLTNIRGTENVLELASKDKIPVFLTSSSEVYGKNISDSLKETDNRILGTPITLRWSYSEAKAIDESLAYAYFVEKQLETRIVRFFNTVGPRQLGAYGMVVPRFVKAALANEPVTIYGDGNQTRCFAHVYDVVDAVIAIAFAENTIGKVINIGNDFEISINGLAQKIIAETDSKSEIVYVPYEEAYGDGFEDMERRVPNIELIHK